MTTREQIEALMAGTHYRHVKRGSTYRLIGYGIWTGMLRGLDGDEVYIVEQAPGLWTVSETYHSYALTKYSGSLGTAQTDKGIAVDDVVVIYRADDDGSLWVRPREEFEDGRFEALALKALDAGSATGVKVKPLMWTRDHAAKRWHGNVQPMTGYSYLVFDDGRWCVNTTYERILVLDQQGNVDAAKAAAQADYEQRILSALARPEVKAEPVAWQWSDFSGKWYTVDTARLSLADQEELARAIAKDHEGRVRPLYANPPVDSGGLREVLQKAVALLRRMAHEAIDQRPILNVIVEAEATLMEVMR